MAQHSEAWKSVAELGHAMGMSKNGKAYTKSGLWTPSPSGWPREAPPAYKSIRKAASGGHFPVDGGQRSCRRTILCKKWPPGVISQWMAQGGPASVQIYRKSRFQRPFLSRWPREAPPACKSLRNVASVGQFPPCFPWEAAVSWLSVASVRLA